MAINREKVLENFAPLRVADVCDAMDWLMLRNIGLMARDIRPLFRPVRVCGIAKTVRYVPTNRIAPTMSLEEYTEFVRDWYANVCTYPFEREIEPGDIIVIDAHNLDVGLLGSNNSLAFFNKGARALVTDGGCRDTDEVIIEKVPVFCRYISRTMVQARMEFESMNRPINCGGVLVRPGDIIVGDGDGVVVVPQEKALEVADIALKVLEEDKIGRRRLYEAAGLPLDDTVK